MQQTLVIAIWVLSGAIISFSLIPLVRYDHWTFRVFEFPRIQKFIINTVIAAAYLSIIGLHTAVDWIIVSLLAANFSYLSYQVYPYLPISPMQIQTAQAHQQPDIKLLIANVYQYNKQFEKLNKLVYEMDADLVLMVETDSWWKEKSLAGFGDKYEYRILEDQENTYGMLIFSKFPLTNIAVRHLIKAEIPSAVMEVTLKNGKKVKLYALHPEPPVPSENPYSTDRDAEILLIGKEAAEEEMPLIVAGDLNDVAWSYTSTLFQKVSGLLDPRRGRGFFSSFHAKYPLLRWPLDHIFCSGHFRVHEMKRLNSIGSDHFPIFISLHLANTEDDSEAFEADEADDDTAREKIESATSSAA